MEIISSFIAILHGLYLYFGEEISKNYGKFMLLRLFSSKAFLDKIAINYSLYLFFYTIYEYM